MSQIVKPTPIQRNDRDVAIELTKLFYERFSFESTEDIANTYLKFYSVVNGASNVYAKTLSDFMVDELKSIYKSK